MLLTVKNMRQMKKVVLVTGGAGFIGSHLVDALIARGESVLVVDDLSTGRLENIKHHLEDENFSFIHGSILDAEIMEKAVLQSSLIFHLAAMVGVKFIVHDPLKCITVNVRGTELLLFLAFQHKKKVILASSSEVYGKSERAPYSEEDERVLGSTNINRWCYSESKAIDEYFALAFARKGLPVVVLRLFNCYGPRINEEGYGTVVAQFLRQTLAGEAVTVFGDGKQTRCFTHVSDLVRAFLLASEKAEAAGKIFNVGSEDEIQILDLARLVKSLTGSSSPITLVPYQDYYGQSYEDTPRRVPNLTKARRLLGYTPIVSLEQGLQETLSWWVRKNGRDGGSVSLPGDSQASPASCALSP